MNLNKYIKENKILLEEHHGGMKNHSTVTAKSLIDYYMKKTLENDNM